MERVMGMEMDTILRTRCGKSVGLIISNTCHLCIMLLVFTNSMSRDASLTQCPYLYEDPITITIAITITNVVTLTFASQDAVKSSSRDNAKSETASS